MEHRFSFANAMLHFAQARGPGGFIWKYALSYLIAVLLMGGLAYLLFQPLIGLFTDVLLQVARGAMTGDDVEVVITREITGMAGRIIFSYIGLLLLTAAAAVGGYLALRFHQDSEKLAAADSAAVKAAMECVAATQAPDTAAMAAGQGKILDCTTGDFGAQAVLFSGVLVDAFRAANVKKRFVQREWFDQGGETAEYTHNSLTDLSIVSVVTGQEHCFRAKPQGP